MILQEFLPDVVQVVLLVLAGLYLINIGGLECNDVFYIIQYRVNRREYGVYIALGSAGHRIVYCAC